MSDESVTTVALPELLRSSDGTYIDVAASGDGRVILTLRHEPLEDNEYDEGSSDTVTLTTRDAGILAEMLNRRTPSFDVDAVAEAIELALDTWFAGPRTRRYRKDVIADELRRVDGGEPMTTPNTMMTPAQRDHLVDSIEIARTFHENYERLAPLFGHETRRETAVPFDDLPPDNRGLMIATAAYVRELIDARCASAALTPQDQWISVKDRLPNIGEAFLARTLIEVSGVEELGYAALIQDEDGVLFYADAGNDEEYGWSVEDEPFTHWMPLPHAPAAEPPKQRITRSAILDRNGEPVSPPLPADHHAVSQMFPIGEQPLKQPQGFLTNTGRFVDRAEARRIAALRSRPEPSGDDPLMAYRIAQRAKHLLRAQNLADRLENIIADELRKGPQGIVPAAEPPQFGVPIRTVAVAETGVPPEAGNLESHMKFGRAGDGPRQTESERCAYVYPPRGTFGYGTDVCGLGRDHLAHIQGHPFLAPADPTDKEKK